MPTSSDTHDTRDLLETVQRARSGDALAFDRLVRRFQDMAFGYALSPVSDRALAEDVAQEAFVEAFRCLPNLRHAAAFPGWLRRLVFKHGDRATRGGQRHRTVPLERARDRADPRSDPAARAERQHDARCVREAVHALPGGERDVTALFYFGGCSVREIATFLEIPEATVRTRLHRARQRLRKELIEMMEPANTPRPSDTPRFADNVLAEIVAEYRRQQREDPETADRSLLAQAKRRLEDHLTKKTPLTWETVHTGEGLLARMGEHDLRAALLRHFLTQKLSVSEEAWARFFLVNALSGAERAEECVAAQEDLYRWARETFPVHPPRLRLDWDFAPTDDPDIETFPADTLLLWTLYIPDAPHHWLAVGRGDDWVRLFYEVLDATPATNAHRQHRFYFLRTDLVALVNLGRAEEARQMADRAAALAGEETDPANALHWRGHAAYLRMIVAERTDDADAFQAAANDARALLADYEQALPPEDEKTRERFSILRDNIASILSDNGRHTEAIPLLRAQIESGDGSAWSFVRLAVSIWTATKDRAETLRLLRQGALQTDRADFESWCRTRPAFADMADDPEFLAATASPPRPKPVTEPEQR